MSGRQILTTDRLLLREFDEGDAEAFYPLGSDPAVTRYTFDSGGGFASVAHALEILRSHPIADYRKYGFGRWVCVEKISGRVIGFAGLKHLEDLGEVDLSYRLLPASWGLGLSTESGRAILNYEWTRLGLSQVIALVAPENVASVRVMEKLGLSFEKLFVYQNTPWASTSSTLECQ